jgi:hypothetical protein
LDEKLRGKQIKEVIKVLSEGTFRTRYIGGKHSTSDMGEAIKNALL